MRDINKYLNVPNIQLMRTSDWTIYMHNHTIAIINNNAYY